MAVPPDLAASLALLASAGETVQFAGGHPPAVLSPATLAPRCLDPSHPVGCTRCTEAPVSGEEGLYELVGDPGRKNGEKLLKSLLSRTPEWRSRDTRAAAALACDEAGHDALARVMRGLDTSAALRKRDMLFLARLWGYKSTLWRTRVARRRGGGAAALDADAMHADDTQGDGQQAALGASSGPAVAAPSRHHSGPAMHHPSASSMASEALLQQLLLHHHLGSIAMAQQQQAAAVAAASLGQSMPQPGGTHGFMLPTTVSINVPGLAEGLPALLLVPPPQLLKAMLLNGPVPAVLTQSDAGARVVFPASAAHGAMQTAPQGGAHPSQHLGQQVAMGLAQCTAQGDLGGGLNQEQGMHAAAFATPMIDIRSVLASLSHIAPAG